MRNKKQPHRGPIRLGFVALADCAPIVMAKQLGLFAKHGVDVELHCEVGWATIRDKIIYRELDAAQAPAPLMIAVNCGLGAVQADCLTGLVLNLHGNAITLSQELWRRGVRDGASLRAAIIERTNVPTFGVVHSYSSHSILLRGWLRSHGIHPERDVRIVTVPPRQMAANMKAGHIDGFCSGEPWNSVAVLSKTGWVVAVSPDLAPRHPEKVLMVRREFANNDAERHAALLAALIESCRFCDRPENRERIAETLTLHEYVNAPIQALRASLGGRFDFGNGRVEKIADFHIFSRNHANEPDAEKGLWLVEQLHATGIVADSDSVPQAQIGEWFRPDIYRDALALTPTIDS